MATSWSSANNQDKDVPKLTPTIINTNSLKINQMVITKTVWKRVI